MRGYVLIPWTEARRGDLFALGDYISVHGTVVQRLIQWTLEHRSANPGIRDGDAFLVNDPWVGAAHQNDTALLRPVFLDGKLFAWVGATLHFLNLGGRCPSSLIPDAQDIFVESVPMPPVKLAARPGRDAAHRADRRVRHRLAGRRRIRRPA
jgi:N-methylhydantoinase B